MTGWWIHGVFFLSGFAALLYQLAWQRALLTIYGANVQSVTIVVTAFLLGLGLGSVAGGEISRRPDRPLLALFGAAEAAIGLFGLASMTLFSWVGSFTAGAPIAAAGALAFVLVLLPTFLMGASLPLLVAHGVRISRNVGRSVGMLYFTNTIGSGAGSLAAALCLMRLLGLGGSVFLAAGVNLTVAAIVFTVTRTAKQAAAATEAA